MWAGTNNPYRNALFGELMVHCGDLKLDWRGGFYQGDALAALVRRAKVAMLGTSLVRQCPNERTVLFPQIVLIMGAFGRPNEFKMSRLMVLFGLTSYVRALVC